ncbi:LPXTG cell wall anchor domain-containing protein [Staphylococcus simiae]|uniref:LPXTG cell wall anchor domain-containing protein n=1 Tax=Staphylococcus simiae TaxID=308354 RepID=UPI001A999BC5|nr:LPXTG cell wall anchor domain-containing protein [Staphylococcus simiae]MBO1198395.1 LPXTG cell wall anchor domain-containing protein [Staphylococcus simiae]MBO1200589.1 LPXTG cell wall anchor domain-containing protein [Staphylococcus simiae]MBO1202860.1 LPXTG cell wall anchor domain-containing protein [Staphylococcus simiae]MBO1210387.1 LPXTG cell wall anchor domain-containing protein [Staphylococcus simiae]MBO1228926.1 LPXTG cell wall anchor domain-containing protein [Staphylococcus simia
MKKVGILGTTALAGALLFTGISSHEANAAESSVNANNAQSIASQVWKEDGNKPELVDFQKAQDKGDYYLLVYNNKSHVGNGAVRVYKDGTVESGSGVLATGDEGEFYKNGKYQFDDVNNNGQAQQEQQQTTTNNNVATQNGQQTQEQATAQVQQQVQAKELPATGEETNTGFVASIATTLLAVGSLLTFKRFSKNNK